MEPLVSIIIPVFNAEKYISEALESIINQTYSNLEIIIIDDGSTDNSLNIIGKYNCDNRIKILKNVENMGLIYSLNKGIKESKGKYIARMDADDISDTTRIEKQVEFMEKNTDICICGTGCEVFFNNNKFLKKKINVETDYEKIVAGTLFKCEFIHPSVIMRTEIISENNYRYDFKFKAVEDYELWSRIINKYKVSNIKESLLSYRILNTSITSNANRDIILRKNTFKMIFKNYLENLGYYLTEEELNIHFEIAMIQNIKNPKYNIEQKREYLSKISNDIKIKYIKEICANQFFKCCVYQGSYKEFKNSYFNNVLNINLIKFVKQKYIEKIKSMLKKKYR